MTLIEKDDLTMGKKGFFPRLAAGAAMSLLGVHRINRLYDKTFQWDGNYAEGLLANLDVQYSVHPKDLEHIPQEGGVIFVSNHPTGMLDGVALIDLLSRSRPDVKFMGNFLLNRIGPLKQYFIAVDPFDTKDAGRNFRGIREALAHVRAGGALVIFPAGEVATWQKGFCRLKDKRWNLSILRFIRGAEVPVVPICIEARNSLMFHLLGKIHPMIRTALLPREFLNKRGKSININIASRVTPRMTAELKEVRTYGDYLRAGSEYMHKKLPRRKLRIIPRKKPLLRKVEPIADSVGADVLSAEIESLRGQDLLLFTHSEYEVFCAPPSAIPNILHEIGRLREITFREVGEGTFRAIDTDFYDTYYHQLFIWNRAESAIVGAYRLGMGDEIAPRFGLKGFYVNSLFRMKKQMLPVMEKTIELGRSFVVKEYQRKTVSLLLLWRGILYVLLKHEQYRNLLGPVTISGEFDKYSKTIIMTHLRQHHMNAKLRSLVRPRTGIRGIDAPIDPALIEKVRSLDLVNKLVMDIERDEMQIPILIKKYLQIGNRVLAFNVDHDFADGLDALMILDLKKMPDNMIAILAKEVEGIDVAARLRHYKE